MNKNNHTPTYISESGNQIDFPILTKDEYSSRSLDFTLNFVNSTILFENRRHLRSIDLRAI
jgi:hypothetical protein